MRHVKADQSKSNEEKRAPSSNTKKVHLEILRVIAVTFVVFNHTGRAGFLLYSVAFETKAYPLYTFISILCKVAVPIFFMVSGALLIPKQERPSVIYRKRIPRVALVLLFFSAIQVLYSHLTHANQLYLQVRSLSDFFRRSYVPGVVGTYGFLYTYIGLLMTLPLLRRLAEGMTIREYTYLFVLAAVFKTLLPTLEFFAGSEPIAVSVPLFSNGVFYFLMGHFFENVLGDEAYCKKNFCLLAGGAVLSLVLGCMMTYFHARATGKLDAERFHATFIAVPSAALFFSAKWLCMRVDFPRGLNKGILWMGSLSFGVYLIEGMVHLHTRFIHEALTARIHVLPACVLWVGVIVLVSMAITAILKKIPFVGKLI